MADADESSRLTPSPSSPRKPDVSAESSESNPPTEERLRLEVQDYIRSLSDEDLLAYSRARTAEYEAEAIAFAKQELAQRHLTPQQIADLEQSAASLQASGEAESAQAGAIPLEWSWRILAVLYGLSCTLFVLHGRVGLAAEVLGVVILVACSLRLREHGFRTKLRQLWICLIVGFLVQLALIYLGVPPWNAVSSAR